MAPKCPTHKLNKRPE